jgi:hypothetical protein
VIIRCNSSGPLYPLHLPPAVGLTAGQSSNLWHHRLGHPGHEVLAKLSLPCNKDISLSLCHACQLGRHTRPFRVSSSRALSQFDLMHCDLWTSPVRSISGFKYYLVILDDHTHYLWMFPLRLESDTFATLANFFCYVLTQFGTTVKVVQCDNGCEFDNSSARAFFSTHGVLLRMTCPYTAQNRRAERIIRSTNNIVRSLLFQASLPPSYWVSEPLATATSMSSTSCRPRRCLWAHPTGPFSARSPHMSISVCSAVSVTEPLRHSHP